MSFETIEHHDMHEEMLDEIKRVLKPEGILVMSSPDKYYYSDISENKNEFHIKELYYKDFKNLINKYFKNTYFFSQKIFVGSIITIDEEKYVFKKPLVVEKDGTSIEFTPFYNITMGTDDIRFFPPYQQILYKESDSILTKIDIDRAIQSVRNSQPFRLGKFFTSPLHFIKKILFK